MVDHPTRREIYSVLSGVAITCVTAAFALDGYRDDARMSENRNVLMQLDARIESMSNRVDLMDSNLTSALHAIITRYPELQYPPEAESNE